MLVIGTPAFAQQRSNTQAGQAGQQSQRQQQSQQGQQQQGQQRQQSQQAHAQTIRGTITGFSAVGEAVIDPQTNTAVTAEADYLTILGTPVHGQAAGLAGAQDQNQQQARADLDELEIGDQVEIQFTPSDRIHHRGAQTASNQRNQQAQGNQGNQPGRQQVGFRGNPNAKHGRDRILIGEAKSISILPEEHSRQHGQSSSSSQSGDHGSKSSKSIRRIARFEVVSKLVGQVSKPA